MSEQIKIGQTFYPRQPIPPSGNQMQSVAKPGSSPFDLLLRREVGKQQEIQFSNHAKERLQTRGIQLTPNDMERLNKAVSQAEEKGARESLILMKDVAFVVSVKNKVVITAVDGSSMKENIFTNIDSAVVL